MADKLVQEQIAEFRETFDMFDLDNDGRLSVHELQTLMNSLGQNPDIGDLGNTVAEFGGDEQGRLEFPDFLALMARKLKDTDPEEELIEAFKIFDRDGDGFICNLELKAAMENVGERLDDSEVNEMIIEADIDRNGRLNYDEFKRIMKAK
mmetsp:Transcript_31024/g.60895  ORF Transcript_31024/g.60895 Transcript_31024/m.60895 type:complete len:150 (+) Transcript_31024:57-506(+)|eukprot:CAMPEP_0172664552 /NCGR_PEP_ID=MMETSP1074-20121228/6677_1 /TAXON_ID=2916 /ORGANISM="Ceratium fusus, Strain PA161109" /LENGTH=149 /DNA_ID=CAMNT_0013480727 /DNA_START=49 /DNA_END=495 /DNA_ORIENTATION=+